MSLINAQLKNVKSGLYQNQYLIYCRKSTDDTENQRNSLDHQEAECERFAKHNQLPVATITVEGLCTNGVISESHSGFKEDDALAFTKDGAVQYRIARPKFNQLVQYLNNGYFGGIICMSWDRLSRNKTDNAIITKLIRSGSDIQFVTATYDDNSAGALHMDIDGMFAQHHSRVTKEKVTNAMHKLRDDGIVVYMAPLGYLNTGKKYKDVQSQEHKPFDPERAPIIKDIFEKYATGTWSMSDLATWATEQGLTNIPRRRPRTQAEMLASDELEIEAVAKPINTNNIHQILRNPFYTGLMQNSQGEWIASCSHKPLVDTVLFQRVQAVRGQKQVSVRYKNPIGHALRGFVRCVQCHRVYTPYTKKGIQYFGARCADGCENTKKSCNLDFIEEALEQRLSGLFLNTAELKEVEQNEVAEQKNLEAKKRREAVQNERQQRKYKEDLSYLYDNRLELLKSGVYAPESYLAEKQRLEAAIAALETNTTMATTTLTQALQDAAKLSELINRLAAYYKLASSPEREEIARTLFSELSLDEKSFGCSLRSEFRALKREGVGFGAPNLWLSELPSRHKEIRHGLEILDNLKLLRDSKT